MPGWWIHPYLSIPGALEVNAIVLKAELLELFIRERTFPDEDARKKLRIEMKDGTHGWILPRGGRLVNDAYFPAGFVIRYLSYHSK